MHYNYTPDLFNEKNSKHQHLQVIFFMIDTQFIINSKF